jgi:uncharacterized membrane protein
MTVAQVDAGLERSIGRLLSIGTYISIALLATGFILLIGSGGQPRTADPGFDPTRLLGDLLAGRPTGFVWLGLVVVVATPAMRVVASLVGYVRREEREMAIVAALILVVIATSVVVARALEG